MLSKIISKLKYLLVALPFALLYFAFNTESVNYFRIRGFLPNETEPGIDWVEKKYNDTLRNYFNPDPDWYPTEVVAQGALLVELESGDILVERSSRQKRKIASLVKIMTAVVALEHRNLKDHITVSEYAAFIGENSMGLSVGEAYTLEELLHGLVMASGNDAAYAIAEGIAGDADTFIRWMNMKGEELGLKNSYFADPSGLDDST